jgi:hypothetical protein
MECAKLFITFSSWMKLQVIAYCLRFVHICQPKNEKKQEGLTSDELLDTVFAYMKQVFYIK